MWLQHKSEPPKETRSHLASPAQSSSAASGLSLICLATFYGSLSPTPHNVHTSNFLVALHGLGAQTCIRPCTPRTVTSMPGPGPHLPLDFHSFPFSGKASLIPPPATCIPHPTKVLIPCGMVMWLNVSHLAVSRVWGLSLIRPVSADWPSADVS